MAPAISVTNIGCVDAEAAPLRGAEESASADDDLDAAFAAANARCLASAFYIGKDDSSDMHASTATPPDMQAPSLTKDGGAQPSKPVSALSPQQLTNMDPLQLVQMQAMITQALHLRSGQVPQQQMA